RPNPLTATLTVIVRSPEGLKKQGFPVYGQATRRARVSSAVPRRRIQRRRRIKPISMNGPAPGGFSAGVSIATVRAAPHPAFGHLLPVNGEKERGGGVAAILPLPVYGERMPAGR